MKPIEPGCLVLLVRASEWAACDIGRVYTAGHLINDDCLRCEFCGSPEARFLAEDNQFVCECCLIRIDGDPDEVEEREEMTA